MIGCRSDRVNRSMVVPDVEARSIKAGSGWPSRWNAALSSASAVGADIAAMLSRQVDATKMGPVGAVGSDVVQEQRTR